MIHHHKLSPLHWPRPVWCMVHNQQWTSLRTYLDAQINLTNNVGVVYHQKCENGLLQFSAYNHYCCQCTYVNLHVVMSVMLASLQTDNWDYIHSICQHFLLYTTVSLPTWCMSCVSAVIRLLVQPKISHKVCCILEQYTACILCESRGPNLPQSIFLLCTAT